jgi:iturin family lipopeptide synthetase A
MNKKQPQKKPTGMEIAVIGMAGRFPGARNINEFWWNLKKGVESITFFTKEELLEQGIQEEVIESVNYIRANAYLEDKYDFDAAFFGYTPKEAMVMDPQIRIFHECAWEALENAGYNPDTFKGGIGLYAGASTSFLWEALIYLTGGKDEVGSNAAYYLGNKDFICTRISYNLNLKGPSYLIQTACSTSLMAIYQGSRALLTGESQIALAGGVCITPHTARGYHYQQGMLLSSDGHCRSFDAKADGTVGGEGVGILVLKRLKTAIREGDHILALILGSASNNDGKRKVGYMAPSVEGQAEVIRAAIKMAQVKPESITYVETHGTGTTLGDPIEIKGLKLAFQTKKKQYCAIGSVKTNVGHLDVAAGVTGFIKTVLALHHGQIPASLNYEKSNPQIDFENSPFFVNTRLRDWAAEGNPRKAGVSSFGIGGTNVHVILEEYPPPSIEKESSETQNITPEVCLFPLSAKTETALGRITRNLREYLETHLSQERGNTAIKPPYPLRIADIAYTLQQGRKEFQYKRMIKGCSIREVIDELKEPPPITTSWNEKKAIFMFSGQGSQYVNMGKGLYLTEPVFRDEMDRCFEILKPLTNVDLKGILYPNEGSKGDGPKSEPSEDTWSTEPINQTENTQPLLFILEYALSKLLISWGITPYAMIGHSIGEYVAACLAGVFSLEDALKLVTIRAKLMTTLPYGAMLMVSMEPQDLLPLLDEGVSLAAVNSPQRCVVSGTKTAINTFQEELNKRECQTRRLHTSHAFHSPMMEPIEGEYKKVLETIKFRKPQIPYISNVSGTWITVQEIFNPDYWINHLKKTVQFSNGIETLLGNENSIFAEIGPGNTLTSFVREVIDESFSKKMTAKIVNLVRHPKDKQGDQQVLKEALGFLWLNNVNVEWEGMYWSQKGKRIPLPTYPFDRYFYGVEKDRIKNGSDILGNSRLSGRKPLEEWFYMPTWTRKPGKTTHITKEKIKKKGIPKNRTTIMVLMNSTGMGEKLLEQLKQNGHQVISVKAGKEFQRETKETLSFTIEPGKRNHYKELFNYLEKEKCQPQKIFHLWTLDNEKETVLEIKREEHFLEMGFFTLFYLAATLGELKTKARDPIWIGVITQKMQDVLGEEALSPGRATLMGPVKVIPLEYPHIKCKSIDVTLPEAGTNEEQNLVNNIISESEVQNNEPVVAFRGKIRWEPTFLPVFLTKPKGKYHHLRERGVYLITGGLGGIGLELARYLARTVKARLILITRSKESKKIKWQDKIREMEKLGAEVEVCEADVTKPEQMQTVVARASHRFGRINGVIHAAGLPDGAFIQRRTRQMTEAILAPKVKGTWVLYTLFKEQNLDFLVLCSSVNAIIPTIGQLGHCAANAFLDTFALYCRRENKMNVVSVNWNSWKEVGQAAEAVKNLSSSIQINQQDGLSPKEGVEVFGRILQEDYPQVVVSTDDFNRKVRKSNTREADLIFEKLLKKKEEEVRSLQQRPKMSTLYVAPSNETEETLSLIWGNYFGYLKVGIQDDFFELGGDSLKAMIIIGKIHKELNLKVTIPEFFNNPTIEKLSQQMRESLPGKNQQYESIEAVEEREYYEVSSAQKRLFILKEIEGTGILYNMPNLKILGPEIEKNKLEISFNQLVERHETLRTSFQLIDGKPVQRIHKQVHLRINYQEGKSAKKGTGKKKDKIQNLIRQSIRPFDLGEAPLFRVTLIKILEKNTHYYMLLTDMHHIICDGLSIALLEKEFNQLYQGESLAPLPLQYKDFSTWQNKRMERMGTGAIKKQEGYWLKTFSNELPTLNLPTDFPRTRIPTTDGNRILLKVEENQFKGLKSIEHKTGATMFMILQAAFTLLLAKYTAQEDIVIGTPISGRPHMDLESIIGMFVNTLALRNFPQPQKTLHKFIEEVRENSLKAFENQDYQFETLVEKLNIPRDLGRNPLFETMLILNKNTISSPKEKDNNWENKDEDLKTKINEWGIRAAKFDLTLVAVEEENRIGLGFEYPSHLFKKETIRRMADQLLFILDQIYEDQTHQLQLKLKDIELVTPAEKERILYEFNDPPQPSSTYRTLHQWFREQSNKTGNKVAVGCSDQKITYKALELFTSLFALVLKKKNVKNREIIALALESSVEMAIGILGILKTGGSYLPIDIRYPKERVNFMLKDSGAKIVISEKSIAYKQDAGKTLIIEKKQFVEKQTEFSVDSGDPMDPANVIYTSGTTGKPKGVIVRHGGLINLFSWRFKTYTFSIQDVRIHLQSFSFDAFGVNFFSSLLFGSSLFFVENNFWGDMQHARRLIWEEKVTHLSLVPSIYSTLLNHASKQELQSLTFVVLGGEKASPSLIITSKEINPGILLVNEYGPTENSIETTSFLGMTSTQCNIIGRPISNHRVYILDENNKLMPPGVPGELCASGKGLATGYLNRPELTREKFIPDPFYKGERMYRTGDMARWQSDGNIEFLGRKDQQMKIGGYRIEPGEIEHHLLQVPGIKEAVVLERSKQEGTQRLCAYIVSQKSVTSTIIRKYLSGQLPHYMIPSVFISMEKIPLTPIGKLDQTALEKSDRKLDTSTKFVKPETDNEKNIAALWKEVLNIRKVGSHDNFFDLGGTSMDIIGMHARLKVLLGVDIPVAALFQYPTIHYLVQYAEGLQDSHSPQNREKEIQKLDQMTHSMQEAVNFLNK